MRCRAGRDNRSPKSPLWRRRGAAGLLILGLLLTLPGPAWGTSSSDTIVHIAYEGLRRIDEAAVKSVLGSQVGGTLDPDVVTADLHALWDTGFFRDVSLSKEAAKDGWKLIVQLKEKPSIHEVNYVGQRALSKEDITEVVNVRPNTILNLELLKANADKIRNLYVEKGHYLAKVDYAVKPLAKAGDTVDVVFEIQENPKVLVKQISFVGNATLRDDKIKAIMQTKEGNELSFLGSGGTYKEEFFQTDLLRIQAFYHDHGFVGVRVGEPTANISPDRRYIYLSIPLEEGERYNVGKVSFHGEVELKDPEGKTLVEEKDLLKRVQVKSGDQFSRTQLVTDIQAITDAYRNHGYAYANIIPNSRPNPETRTVDLEFSVEKGERVYIGRIEIVGNTRTRDKVIRREMRVVEGELYRETGVKASEARITQLGYFERVEIKRSAGAEPDVMDLTIHIKEKSTGTFQVGAGFSSVESFIATAQISQQNFLGKGQSLSLSAQLSFGNFGRKLATLQFWEPYFLDSFWAFGLNAYLTQHYYQDFMRNSTGISPTLGYPITHDLRVSLGYTLEEVEISTDGVGSVPSGVSLNNLNTAGLSSAVKGSISYDTRDNRLFPTRGVFHVLDGELSAQALGADESMAYKRLNLAMRFYQPVVWKFILKFNASFGYIFGGSKYGVPVSERFFPGGIYTIRGFQPRSLGPTQSVLLGNDPNSSSREFNIGGNKQALFNLELEFPILEAAGVKGVFFADAGNAYADSANFFNYDTHIDTKSYAIFPDDSRGPPPLGMYWSVGLGFRWFSPIGPLRFEWGFPITKHRRSEDDSIFEFTIGNFF